jgi:hypothetical protein
MRAPQRQAFQSFRNVNPVGHGVLLSPSPYRARRASTSDTEHAMKLWRYPA